MTRRRNHIQPEWLTLPHGGQYVDGSARTLKRLIAAGLLPAYRMGPRGHLRVRRRDLDQLMEAHSVAADLDRVVDEIMEGLER